jgi:SHS family lactate transporter-like MFS transporter
MGGEWGVGASLAMESVPVQSRGILSGILQQGYPAGYMLAALAVWAFLPHVGWRGMFIIGVIPAILVIFIRMHVPESPAWQERARAEAAPGRSRSAEFWTTLGDHWKLILYMALLMVAFNCFSHGTQDLYPKGFLGAERKLPLRTISEITIINNLGAIAGGILFGALSQRLGRRRAIAGAALLALPMISLWVGGTTVAALALGGFLIQFAVQGAWGVVPVHLNELSPALVRGTLPGFAYQLGNLGASYVGPLQASLAESHGGRYSFALAWVVGIVAVVLAALALLGPEARTAELAPERP